MAKKSMIAREVKRKKMVEKYLDRRNKLRSVSLDNKLSLEDRMAARRELFELPKNLRFVRLSKMELMVPPQKCGKLIPK